MTGLRVLLTARRGWFALLVACALAVRLMVPVGFMPAVEGGRLTLTSCSGAAPAAATPAMAGMHHEAPDGRDRGKPEMPCAFAGPGLATADAIDPVLLATAILFAFVFAVRAVALALPAAPVRWRPPLRAPPPVA